MAKVCGLPPGVTLQELLQLFWGLQARPANTHIVPQNEGPVEVGAVRAGLQRLGIVAEAGAIWEIPGRVASPKDSSFSARFLYGSMGGNMIGARLLPSRALVY